MSTAQARNPARSPWVSTPKTLDAWMRPAWSRVTITETGRTRIPIPRKSQSRRPYIERADERTCPQVRRRASRNGAAGRQVVRVSANATRATSASSVRSAGRGLSTLRRSALEPFATAVQKKSVAPVPIAPPPGTAMLFARQESCDQVIGAVHCDLRFGPGRPVEERALQLAPAAAEPDPRKRGQRRGRVARDRLHDRMDVEGRPARVVAADALRGGAAEIESLAVEVRVRPGRRMHDRVGAVDELELRVVPRRPFGALVLAVADRRGRLRERLGRGGGVEVELDHLPVALVRVVPVVEDVVEPVLERELPGVGGIGHDVRVGRRRRALRDQPPPLLVPAARVERAAREVEVVLVPRGREIVRRGPDLHEVVAGPGPAERDRRLAEERVDVDRHVRLAGAALLGLRHEPDDRCEALRERLLVRQGGARELGHDERGRGRQRESEPPHCAVRLSQTVTLRTAEATTSLLIR